MTNNILDYLVALQQERYRTFIMHAEPSQGPALTTFCKKICNKTNGRYIDLLSVFTQSSELCEGLDVFGSEKFKVFLLEQSQMQSFLAVDHIDFLVDTWRKSERQDFYRLINNQWDGYKDGMQTKVLFCMQTSHDFESLAIKDSVGNSRIFSLSDFNEII
jgi:hypothetical protein